MNFLHKIQRKRNIKRLAYLNQKIEYCHETIDATQKCINNLEIGLKRVLSHPSPVFVVCYSSDYTNPIEKHLEKLSCECFALICQNVKRVKSFDVLAFNILFYILIYSTSCPKAI